MQHFRTCSIFTRWRRSDPGSSRSNSQRVPTAVGKPAAIDRQADAVHKSLRITVSEKGNRCGHVFGSCEARQRHAIENVRVRVGTAALVGSVHLGLDPARADRVDTHSAAAPFGSKRAGKPDETVLRCIVGAAVADPGKTRYRCNIDAVSYTHL